MRDPNTAIQTVQGTTVSGTIMGEDVLIKVSCPAHKTAIQRFTREDKNVSMSAFNFEKRMACLREHELSHG